jgi:hypothetical protein
MTKTISKSSYIRGMKCQKSLWLHFFQPEDRDEISESQQNIYDTGHNVGLLAQQRYPEGIDASRGEPGKVSEAVAFTQELIASGQTVIYEAAFSDGETLCYMDILVKKNGKWQAFEVKATTSVKDYHIQDAAFQYYVITRSGLPLGDIFLVHLNNQYVRRGAIDVQLLFKPERLTDIVRSMQETIPVNLGAMQQMLLSGGMPDIAMGPHCTHPFGCDFMEFCRRDIAEAPEIVDRQPASRDQDALDDFKATLAYPLFFFDFETIMPPVPYHDESRPYQQIPFQYSLHIVRHPGNMDLPEHFEFLGAPPADPRPALIEALLTQLGTRGSIIVWNATFEKTRLKEMARDFPQYTGPINALFDRMVDLMVPFRRKHLYTPEMNGSYSLKAVLPALVPELSYSELGIQEGGTASLTYLSFYDDTDPESASKKREDLLKYCALDTLSMVRILGVI